MPNLILKQFSLKITASVFNHCVYCLLLDVLSLRLCTLFALLRIFCTHALHCAAKGNMIVNYHVMIDVRI